jgi:hypothetical protein
MRSDSGVDIFPEIDRESVFSSEVARWGRIAPTLHEGQEWEEV